MASEVTAQVNIEMPREQAWGILSDLSLAHNYVPGIVRTELTTDIKQGVGASRKVYNTMGKPMDETVTEWDEGFGFRIRLHKGDKDAPFKNAYFIYRIEDGANNTTDLTTTMGYTLPMGAVGGMLDSLLLNRIISGVIRDVAVSMKHFYEQGSPTSKQDLKALKKQLKSRT